ncbi:F-box protein [Trifolium pratense]|uniref:F-box protein n=1 Tax=Trifolium pratense TaxID=57577 RepID=A0A2K3NB03_TRIPR|nr:F-box protein [Trifolium pratense]
MAETQRNRNPWQRNRLQSPVPAAISLLPSPSCSLRPAANSIQRNTCSSNRVAHMMEEERKPWLVYYSDSAFACEAINPEIEGGRVYIALKNCNFVYIYNIEDKSLATSQHFSNLSKTPTHSLWFMPETRMPGPLKEELGKAHQVRQREGISEVVHSKDTEDKAHNGLSLPRDVFDAISKCINNVLDYLNFRASNKLIRLVAPPIQWRSSSSMSMSRFDDLSTCPLFAFSQKNKVFTFVHPKHGLEYKSIIKFPQDLHPLFNLEICCSKDGWLLLVGFQVNYQVFFNPFTKEVLPLPFGNKQILNIRGFGMSHSPTSNECVTVELIKLSKMATEAYVHHLQEGQCHRIEIEDGQFPLFNTNPTFHNGLFYYLGVTGKLAVIEVKGEVVSWKILEKPPQALQVPCSGHLNNFLVECDGNLLAVFESPFAKGVKVFKLNEDTMTWMKVESLENHMLFVGKTSFSAVANILGMENKIYFNRFYGDSVVFYSLETNNYHTFKNDEVVNFDHVREQLNGSWIQPRWHQI